MSRPRGVTVPRLPDRAVAVALHDGRVLVMRRHRQDEDYCVLPGGGVEPGEEPGAAVVRELREETGLDGVVDRHLATIEHPDRVAHYFLVRVEPGPMAVGGPEALAASDQNVYRPAWVSVEQLAAEDLRPGTVRALLLGLAPFSPPPTSGRHT